MDEEHVDVAGVVELTAAELSHRDDPERDLRRDQIERAAEAYLCQRGQLAADGGKIRRAEQIARCGPQELTLLPPAKRARAAVGGGEERGGGVAVLGELVLAPKALAVPQWVEQRGIPHDRTRQRARRRAQGDERVAYQWVRGELVAERGVIVQQPRQERPGRRRVGRALDRGVERG